MLLEITKPDLILEENKILSTIIIFGGASIAEESKTKVKIDGLKKLIKNYENKLTPKMPVSAELLMKKYEIPEGKQLGEKLRIIETEWVKNNFRISEQQVDKIVNN